MSKVGKSHCQAEALVHKLKYPEHVEVPEQNRELFFKALFLSIISPPHVDHLPQAANPAPIHWGWFGAFVCLFDLRFLSCCISLRFVSRAKEQSARGSLGETVRLKYQCCFGPSQGSFVCGTNSVIQSRNKFILS